MREELVNALRRFFLVDFEQGTEDAHITFANTPLKDDAEAIAAAVEEWQARVALVMNDFDIKDDEVNT